MASIKTILRINKIKPDGTAPIIFRITSNRKVTEHFSGQYIKPEEWDEKNSLVKKSHSNSVRLNHLIEKKRSEISDILLEAQSDKKALSKKQIKHKIKTNNTSSFFEIAKEHLSDLLKLKKYNQHSGEKPRVDHFKSFLETDDISFQEITIPLLKKFSIYLKSEKNLSDRSVVNCLVVIRTIYNKGISLGLVDYKHYPFGPGKIQIKFPESVKQGLSEDEIRLFENFNLEEGSQQWNARNVWLTSFYMAGIRVSDVIQLKWQDINDNRLTYRMGKNKKIVSLKVPKKVLEIITYYSTNKKDSIYIFPYLKNENEFDKEKIHSRVRSVNSLINKYNNRTAKAAEINKKMSMHISRHSFGNIAGDKISPQALQKLYRHSDIKTTIGYQSNFIHQDVDDALDSVINF